MKKSLRFSLVIVIFTFLLYQVKTKSILNSKSSSGISSSPTKGPPTLSETADKVFSAKARENVDIKCPIGGDPVPMYEWYRGPNETERIVDSWDRFYIAPNDPYLKIRSVTHEDSGVYTCKAINGFGPMIAPVQLLIIGDDPFKDNLLKSSTSKRTNYNGSYTEPEILMDHLPPEKVLRKSKGENLLLKCEAKGNPRPTITWLKDNQYLLGSRDNVSSLKLTNLSESLGGIYKCEARNMMGISVYEVHVEVTGSWIGKAEILELSPANLTLFPGESGNITCVARFESESQPTFVWVKKLSEKPDPESKNIVYYEGEYYEVLSRPEWNKKEKFVFTTDLILRNVSRADTGSYHCVVYGLMGYIHSEAQVFIQTDPAQLQSVRLNKERGVTVQWTVLWASAFLVVAVMIVTCFVRLHGCRGQPKRVPLRTPIPKKSPGETVSTTLTHHNDVYPGLVEDNMTIMSSSASAKRFDGSVDIRCSSDLSGLPESDVTDVMLTGRRARKSHHPKHNLNCDLRNLDVDSYHFFPQSSRPPNNYHSNGARAHRSKTRGRGNKKSRSSSNKWQEDFSDIELFPSSASAFCPPNNTRESGSFSSPSSKNSSNNGLRAVEYYSQNYYQPPCSPVSSTRSYSKMRNGEH